MARMASPQDGKAEKDRFCTYRVFDPDIQKFIYVGMTSNLQRRIKEHGKNSKWWKPTLRFDAIKENMGREEASANEKYWIQYYADRGHPLENWNSKTDQQLDRFIIMESWLGADTKMTPEEKEEVLLLFLKGRNFVYKRENDQFDEWHVTQSWDIFYDVVLFVSKELQQTHLTHLDIARLTAKAVGMNIDEEVQP